MSKQQVIDTKVIGSVTKHAAKLERERRKTLKQQETSLLLRQIVASPAFQMVGTVAIAETLEAVGILSGRWAGALEGGVIAMTGLQALKDYGVIGAGSLGLGIGTGALLGDILGEDDYIKKQAKLGLTGMTGLDAALAQLGIIK